MMYSLRLVIRSQRVKEELYDDPRLVAGLAFLALELSRHRTVAKKNEVCDSEHDWLLKQENTLADYLRKHPAAAMPAAGLLLDALKEQGLSFYEGVYPLVMLDILCTVCQVAQSVNESRVDDLVTVAASALLDSSEALDTFTLPTSSPFDIILDRK